LQILTLGCSLLFAYRFATKPTDRLESEFKCIGREVAPCATGYNYGMFDIAVAGALGYKTLLKIGVCRVYLQEMKLSLSRSADQYQ